MTFQPGLGNWPGDPGFFGPEKNFISNLARIWNSAQKQAQIQGPSRFLRSPAFNYFWKMGNSNFDFEKWILGMMLNIFFSKYATFPALLFCKILVKSSVIKKFTSDVENAQFLKAEDWRIEFFNDRKLEN